jgi:hypothetical protein
MVKYGKIKFGCFFIKTHFLKKEEYERIGKDGKRSSQGEGVDRRL